MQAIEIGRFRVSERQVERFLADRPAVDEALKALPGFLGSNLVHISGGDWLLLVRWESHEAVLAAQQITAQMQIISDWIGIAEALLSFDTADVPYISI